MTADLRRRYVGYLVKRQFSENLVSDLLWALLRTVDGLTEYFLAEVLEFPETRGLQFRCEREFNLDEKRESRPDLVFLSEDRGRAPRMVVILENKLWDTSYHFEQYREAAENRFPRERTRCLFVQVAAHVVRAGCDPRRLWKLLRWCDILDRLRRFDTDRPESSNLAHVFCNYVEAIVTEREIDVVRFDGNNPLKGLFYFDNLVHDIVTTVAGKDGWAGGANARIYAHGNASSRGAGWNGVYVELVAAGCAEALFYPFFGIYYLDTPTICVVVDEYMNGKAAYRFAKSSNDDLGGGITTKAEDDDNELLYRLAPEDQNRFLQADLQEQRNILATFLEKTCAHLAGLQKRIRDAS
ncbi:MAG: hypothetical protein ABIK09_06850 [Pseudomonadota bacterium]